MVLVRTERRKSRKTVGTVCVLAEDSNREPPEYNIAVQPPEPTYSVGISNCWQLYKTQVGFILK